MAWFYSEELKARTGNGWSDEPEPETTMLTAAGPTDILSAGGILRAPEVVELAAAAGLDLAAAAVVLLKETGGGRNVWGHDNVVVAPGTYTKGAEVTKAAYLAYIQAVKAGRAGRQGVGPLQLTWSGYQAQADQLGGCWDWRSNVTVGFQALAAHIRSDGLRNGFRNYNGSGPAAEKYAADAMAKYDVWRVRLGTPEPVGDCDVAPQTAQQIDEIHEQVTGILNAWGGGVTDANNTKYNLLQYVLRSNVETHQVALMCQKLLDLQKDPAKQQVRLRDGTVDEISAGVHARLEESVADITHRAVVDEMATSGFWASALERMAKTFAGSLLTLLGAGPLDVLHIPWESTLSLAAGSALVSLLMSLASSQTGTKGSPSLLRGGE